LLSCILADNSYKIKFLTGFFHQLLLDLQQSSWLERVAVVAGIASVWFSRIENIWVYPVGLINTIIYIWLSLKGDLLGEASVNFYYTVMSIYGWIIWARRSQATHEHVVHITFSDKKWWSYQLLFFAAFYVAIFFSLTYLKKDFAPGAIPWADAFASSTAFTGMWLMTKKKVESWHWWIATNIASIPLYYVKGYALTSVYYIVLLVMAIFGLMEWNKRARVQRQQAIRSRR
jgi:nicotinamide mononucleotide transporter